MNNPWSIVLSIIAAVLLVAVIFVVSLLPFGNRSIGAIENIAGIPYPQVNGSITVLERLAHADVYLNQPVLGQSLKLTITFIPHNVRKLAVGVRENDFWLSYNPILIYEGDGSMDKPITKTITILLADKFEETDQSLDLMFFATSDGQSAQTFPGDAVTDITNWEIKSLTVKNSHYLPAKAEIADYLRSIVKKERAL